MAIITCKRTSCEMVRFWVLKSALEQSKIKMNPIQNSKRVLFIYTTSLLIFLTFCSEVPIISSKGEYRLDSPSSMVIIPGQPYGIIANANVNLNQTSGALMAIDLNTNELLPETLFEIPNFAGDMVLDSVRKRIYIPDHDQALLVYSYKIPGSDGKAISFSKVKVPEPVNNDRGFEENGVQTDDGPAQVLMIPGTTLGDLLLVANQKGSISMIPAETLKLKDMDSDPKYFGLRLISASNFKNASNFPGRGASRMAVSPTTGLVYVTSSSNNQIYVINPVKQTIEAMIDLDSISLPTVGMRDIEIDNNEIAYVAHSGLDSIVVLDVSNITKNNILYEVVTPSILDVIPVGDGPEDLALKTSGLELFVSNENDDSVFMIDTAARQVTKKLFLNRARNPGRLILDESLNTLFCLNFFSNTISLIDPTSVNLTGVIK